MWSPTPLASAIMLRLVAARLANRPPTDLFCARTRNASFLPANHPHCQPCPARVRTRKPPRCRAQHAPVLQRTPHAVPSTRPHPHTTLFSAAPPVSTPGGPFPRPWTSSPPGMTPPPLRRPARQYARGSFPETLDLKSTWYDATVTEMLAASVNRTLTAFPRASPPRWLVAPLPLPPLPPRRLLRLGSALLYPPLSLFEYMVMFPSGLSSVSLWCSLRRVVLFFSFI